MPSLGYNAGALLAAVGLSVKQPVLGRLVHCRLGTYLTEAWWRSGFEVIAAISFALVVAGLLHSWLPTTRTLADLPVSGTAGGLTYLATLRLFEKSCPP